MKAQLMRQALLFSSLLVVRPAGLTYPKRQRPARFSKLAFAGQERSDGHTSSSADAEWLRSGLMKCRIIVVGQEG